MKSFNMQKNCVNSRNFFPPHFPLQSSPMISLVTIQTKVQFWSLMIVKHSSPRKFPFSVLMHYKRAGPSLSILKPS